MFTQKNEISSEKMIIIVFFAFVKFILSALKFHIYNNFFKMTEKRLVP